MIDSIKDYNNLFPIFVRYKKEYKPIINEFTHNYVYMDNGNNIIGFILFSVIYENCEIIDIFVDNENRKKGIGNLLLKCVIENYGNKSITLEVNINNVPAINLYEKNDFKKVALRKGYYNGIDGILMHREVR